MTSGFAPNVVDRSVIDAVNGLLDLKLPEHGPLHVLAAEEPPLTALREIEQTAYAVSQALAPHLSFVLAEQKTVASLRQYTNDARSLHSNAATAKALVEALKSRPPALYGEDIPLDRNVLSWIVHRLEVWGKAVGMEVFQEPPENGELVCLMAGKVVVIDLIFSVGHHGQRSSLKTLKLSYASPNESSASSPLFVPDEADPSESYSLDKFLFDTLYAFIEEVQAGDDIALPSASQAAKLGENFRGHLKYLMKLDGLASSPRSTTEHSVQWLNDVNMIATRSWALTRAEVELSRSIFGDTKVPLDVFLVRSHALPLPYLTGASVSFLAHVSPLAYLKLLRRASAEHRGPFDISLSDLRKSMLDASQTHGSGFTWASIDLISPLSDPVYAESFSVPSRPTLDPRLPDELRTQPITFSVDSQFSFVLTIEGGGIVMSESRLREIQQLLGISSIAPDLYGPMLPLRFSWAGSWVDLLLNSAPGASSECYTTILRSPRNLHPPLRLRLTAPNEPGFVLSRVPVKSFHQVIAVLEIVKEQAWVNELLRSCDWVPEVIDAGLPSFHNYGDQTLESLLTGSYTPESLPVQLSFVHSAPSISEDVLAAAPVPHSTIRMVVPRQRGSHDIAARRIATVTLTLDPTFPRGVRAEVDGAPVHALDEAIRRGGGLGIGGRLWAGLVAT